MIEEIKAKEVRIIEIKRYNNGIEYKLINELDSSDYDKFYTLYYSREEAFISNNMGANDELKKDKIFYLISLNGNNIAIKTKDNEVLLLKDDTKIEDNTLNTSFDANLKRTLEVLNLNNEEELLDIVSDKKRTLTLIK